MGVDLTFSDKQLLRFDLEFPWMSKDRLLPSISSEEALCKFREWFLGISLSSPIGNRRNHLCEKI